MQPGSTYELSVWVKCDREFTMRYNLLGKAGAKRSTRLPATKGWQRVSLEAVIPENGVEAMSVGWQLLRTRGGVILLDDVVIRRLNEVTVTQEGGGEAASLPPARRAGLAHLLQDICPPSRSRWVVPGRPGDL